MTSEERRQARYNRRLEKRNKHKQERAEQLGSLNDVFQFHSLFNYGLRSCRGVR